MPAVDPIGQQWMIEVAIDVADHADLLHHPLRTEVALCCEADDFIARKFNVSQGVVYYWIDRGIIVARQDKPNQPYWITLAPEQENELNQWVQNSTRIKSPNIPNAP